MKFAYAARKTVEGKVDLVALRDGFFQRSLGQFVEGLCRLHRVVHLRHSLVHAGHLPVVELGEFRELLGEPVRQREGLLPARHVVARVALEVRDQGGVGDYLGGAFEEGVAVN